MKKKTKYKAPQNKKGARLIVAISSALIVIAVLVFTLIPSAKEKGDRELWDQSAEGYLLQHASASLVHEGYRPVLIYRYRGTNRAAFTAVGTWFMGTNGPIVATVEHLLQPKFSNEIFVVRFLSPDEHTATSGIQEIVAHNTDVGLPSDDDVVFVRLKNESGQRLPCVSTQSEEVPQTVQAYLCPYLEIGGRTVRHLKSLVTGDEYPIAGAVTSPRRILIRYHSNQGESGTGFVDEYGQLYVLSGSPKGTTNKITLLSGPYANLGKRL